MIGIGTHLVRYTNPGLPAEAADTSVYADFTRGIYALHGEPVALDALLLCARASSGQLHSGQIFGVDQARAGARGMLVEEARTNYFLHSHAPVTQTLALDAGEYCLSLQGTGAVALSGAATGVATEGASQTFSLASAGAVTASVSGAVTWVQVENGGFATSPIATGAASAGRMADVITMVTPNLLTPQATEVIVEWEQMQSGSFATNGVNTLMRWSQTSWSRLRAGSVTFAQVAGTTGALALNKGVGTATPVGLHQFRYRSTGSGMTLWWGDSLNGAAGSGGTANLADDAAVQSVQLGATASSEALNGYIRKLVIRPLDG